MWQTDLFAEGWNKPKTRAIRGLLFYDLFFFPDPRVLDGGRVEYPHQMFFCVPHPCLFVRDCSLERHTLFLMCRFKAIVKFISNHVKTEIHFAHVRWIRKLVWRLLLKGMRFGEGLRYQLGPGCQDIRDPTHPELLDKLFHSSILHPHHGLL